MKNLVVVLFITGSLLLHSCSDNTENKNSAVENNGKTDTPIASNASLNEEVQGDGIVGEWQLKMKISDSNGNDKIDEDEKKDPMTVGDILNEDYLKFNADGSGLIYTIKKEGRYELKESSSGKKYVTWYDQQNNVLRKMGHVFSVTKDELIFLDKFAGATFSIYKRK